jgi:hypothetical protein
LLSISLILLSRIVALETAPLFYIKNMFFIMLLLVEHSIQYSKHEQ